MPLLDVNDLTTYFHTRNGVVRAVDGVSFQLEKGETLVRKRQVVKQLCIILSGSAQMVGGKEASTGMATSP